jgi:hypothetical protein
MGDDVSTTRFEVQTCVVVFEKALLRLRTRLGGSSTRVVVVNALLRLRTRLGGSLRWVWGR